jgi:hypothetical protein
MCDSVRGSARLCTAVVVIVVILRPPCFATNCCYKNTAAPVVRKTYYYNARVMFFHVGGLRMGHLRICGWSTDLWVGIRWSTGYPCCDHGVLIGLINVLNNPFVPEMV